MLFKFIGQLIDLFDPSAPLMKSRQSVKSQVPMRIFLDGMTQGAPPVALSAPRGSTFGGISDGPVSGDPALKF